MGSHREVGGVAVAFLGFAFLVLAFKGTWHNVYAAALGQTTTTPPKTPGAGTAARTPAQGLPGGAPTPNPLAGRK